MRNLKKLYIVCAMVWILTACSLNIGSTTSPGVAEQPYACQGREQPLTDRDSLKFTPDCLCVDSVESGMSWQGLRIGEATLSDVSSTLGKEGVLNSEYHSWRFHESNTDTLQWGSAEACFVDDKLAILYIELNRDPELMELEQVLNEYGSPNRVTWGTDYKTRALVWSEKGLLIFVRLSGLVNGPVVLFSPIPSTELEASWLMASLPDELYGSPPDDVDYGPELYLEDPWGIQQ